MAHVMALGGGFGGLAAAHKLRRRLPSSDDVTVVAASEVFYVGSPNCGILPAGGRSPTGAER